MLILSLILHYCANSAGWVTERASLIRVGQQLKINFLPLVDNVTKCKVHLLSTEANQMKIREFIVIIQCTTQQFKFQYLAQGYSNVQSGDWASDPAITGQTTLPPWPQPPQLAEIICCIWRTIPVYYIQSEVGRMAKKCTQEKVTLLSHQTTSGQKYWQKKLLDQWIYTNCGSSLKCYQKKGRKTYKDRK